MQNRVYIQGESICICLIWESTMEFLRIMLTFLNYCDIMEPWSNNLPLHFKNLQSSINNCRRRQCSWCCKPFYLLNLTDLTALVKSSSARICDCRGRCGEKGRWWKGLGVESVCKCGGGRWIKLLCWNVAQWAEVSVIYAYELCFSWKMHYCSGFKAIQVLLSVEGNT